MNRRTVSVVLAAAAAGVIGLSATVAQAASAPDPGSSSITTTTVSADGALTVDTFPATTTMPQSKTQAAAVPSVQEPLQAGSGIVSVDLEPAAAASVQPAAAAAPARIHCKVDLRQYVHYSRKTGDTSWHWTWKCDDVALLTAHSILYAHAFGSYYAAASGSSTQSGLRGNVNIRTHTCVRGPWFGQASGTFSAPNHLSRTFEGSSPVHKVKC